MENLIELPIDKWPVLQEKLKELWPLNVPGFYTIYFNLKYQNVREVFNFKIYCPFGDMDNGFVGINEKPGSNSQDIILFSTTRDTSKLEQALVQTKLIDWSRKVCIDLVSSLILRSLENIRPAMGFSYYSVGLATTYFLDKKSKPFENIRCPPNAYIAPIRENDLEHVNNLWPYKNPDSLFYFSTFTSNNLSYGLYSENKLLAWVFINEYNFICHLYCEEEHRKKGYAMCVMMFVVNEQLGQGNDLYGYVVQGNEKSKRLFEKLGFADVDKGGYLYVQK